MVALHLAFAGVMVATGLVALAVSKEVPEKLELQAHYSVPHTATMRPAAVGSGGSSILHRASDGLFYIEGQANGQSVRFVVDTGATVVVLNRADAARLGITLDNLKVRGSIRTVKGLSDVHWATIDRLEVLGKPIENVSAAVVDAPLPASLMGHNVLMRLGTVTMQGDTLEIR